MPKYCGLVEGFYWKREHSVEGRYAEFDKDKRKKLLEFMGTKGLNIYVYDPKILRGNNYERAYSPALIGDAHYWKETFRIALDNGINFVWGLSPGRHEHWHYRITNLYLTTDFLLDLGAAGISLLFDDVPGAGTESEMEYQAELANILNMKYPGEIYGLCSGLYCGTRKRLENGLAILDDTIDPSIDLIFTGREVWPKSIKAEDLPRYESGRKSIVWENWVACDTNDPERLEFRPPEDREPDLFRKINGYWLNPSFPVERVIHMVSAVGEMFKYGGSFPKEEESGLIRIMAKDWANFLEVDEEPILRFMLLKTGYEKSPLPRKDIQQIIDRWPSLEPVLKLACERE